MPRARDRNKKPGWKQKLEELALSINTRPDLRFPERVLYNTKTVRPFYARPEDMKHAAASKRARQALRRVLRTVVKNHQVLQPAYVY